MTYREMTEKRIAVMQAYLEGKTIDSYSGGVLACPDVKAPLWDWVRYDYCVRPTPLEGYARVLEEGRSDAPVLCGGLFIDKADCERSARALGGRVVKFREVIEEN